MKQNCVYIVFLLMCITERMFVIIGSFLFGYCLGYYSFDLLKYKNRKQEIHGMQRRVFDEKIGRNKNQ